MAQGRDELTRDDRCDVLKAVHRRPSATTMIPTVII
jgi:hypothetical protein